MTTLTPYLAPLVPIAGRALLCIHWKSFMGELLPEEAQDRDVQRGYVLSLAGFSFTAFAAFVLLDPAVQMRLQLPTWYALVSFVAFFAAINLHAYKASRWQNQLASALQEVGTLSLLLVLVALLLTSPFARMLQLCAMFVVLVVWLGDFLVRLRLDHCYFRDKDLAAQEKGGS